MTIIERPSVVTPADGVAGPEQGRWTSRDYRALSEDGQRYEVVRGVLYMSPPPSVEHQRIVKAIVAALSRAVEVSGAGEVFVAPLDVELNYQNVVQPDVFVVLREHSERVAESRIIGAPDLVIEVASPGTARHDLSRKLDAYAQAGVPEYWIVLPGSKTVEVLVLRDGTYASSGLFSGQMMLTSLLLQEVPINVADFFLTV